MKPLAIVNPAAGGKRCGRTARAALEGLDVDEHWTVRAGEAVDVTRREYAAGRRAFLAVGGDGTAHEIVNGLYPEALNGERPLLGLMPLGTGNSFLRDFTDRGAVHTLEALRANARRTCDVVRVEHDGGVLWSLNLVTVGFSADVAATVNRRFKPFGEAGYLFGVIAGLARMKTRPFPHRCDGDAEYDARPLLLLSVSNSRYTGGKMLLAPHADASDGLLEIVRFLPMGRFALLRRLPRLYRGTHLELAQAERRVARRVELSLEDPVDTMVDGEVLRLRLRSIEIAPAALDVVA